ncbi:hypothetical protein [Streptosporangium sp. NPDC049078]|uniref:hypothetical protein n=1 Tax=Streptosporangium sp. NPDC049078 TaxID=3155767 RepID=UPI00343DCC19
MSRKEPSSTPAKEDKPLGPQSVREVALADDASATSTVEAQTATGEPGPPYYIAAAPLFIDDQFSRAFNVGDRVPAEHVEKYGWADKVRPPAAPQIEPETAPGQATSSKEGDA